ncbi:MAG: hydroxymethylglutaryl-CoA reductase (NADPH) [Methanocalculaceae archaeon]|jgi:hydroxymethylglutaryl-CoA reductase (NADPH)|nr:hydroxymethylglutaryl-CoA reductase (NADPH) [Methanocalculaceae archaeon]
MDEQLAKIRSGELKLYALEKLMPTDEAITLRRKYIEEETSSDLTPVGEYTIPIDRVVTRNIENMIGCVQIPIGIAGPATINGEYAKGEFWLPLATTEGALIASINRGCGAIRKAGGAEVRILRDGMTRAPVFAATSVAHATEVARWTENNLLLLKIAAEKTTHYGELIGLTTYVVGTSVFVRFEFDTKDAMGMNMATIASEAAAKLIETETGARMVSTSGNMCCDKKPSAINVIEGRGKSIVAGVFLSDELIAAQFKTDAQTLLEVNTRKNLVGSARAVSFGFNAHAANAIAAIFLACGQDPAHVVEGSNAITTVDMVPGGVYVSVSLPSLQVGTIGGGTGIATQQACLSILGVANGGENPGDHAKAFGEIVATAVLAGELSLLGALGTQHLAKAHRELGRGWTADLRQ